MQISTVLCLIWTLTMFSSRVYIALFAVLISAETSFAILCSSERPPCPEGFFCFNITCNGLDIGRCTDIDECESNPCQNGGTCNNLVANYTCSCPAFWEGYNCDVFTVDATDCLDLLNAGITTSGIYPITLWSTNTIIDVYCDMQTDGGGWTVFQNRLDGSLDFNRVLSEYENGFGDLSYEFWLGLKHVQEIAAQGQTKLRIHLIDVDDNFFYREYMDFSLTTSLYVLNIGAASGTPLVSTWANLGYNNGMPFTTVDSDNDENFGDNCAVVTQSGWWHRWCYWVNLNGQYATPGTATILGSGWQLGIVHRGFTDWIAFKSSSMMVRRV